MASIPSSSFSNPHQTYLKKLFDMHHIEPSIPKGQAVSTPQQLPLKQELDIPTASSPPPFSQDPNFQEIIQHDSPPPSPQRVNEWDFLHTNRERAFSIISNISFHYLRSAWTQNAPHYLAKHLSHSTISTLAPVAATIATLTTQLCLRTFDYSRELDQNPVPITERINRSIKSLAEGQLSRFFSIFVFSSSFATASAAAGYLGATSWYTYYPVSAPVFIVSFIGYNVLTTIARSLINYSGARKTFSKSVDWITQSKPKIRHYHEERNQIDPNYLILGLLASQILGSLHSKAYTYVYQP